MKYRSLLLLFGLFLSPFSAAALNAVYPISDIDVKIFIRQMNNIEQCIYPELGKPNAEQIYQSWSEADRMVMHHYQDIMLESLIGRENFLLFRADQASQVLFEQKINRFNHQNANVSPELCAEFKQEYAKKKVRAAAILQSQSRPNHPAP